MTEITDEMLRVVNGDYLVKGIGAREAVRRILVLAEKQVTVSDRYFWDSEGLQILAPKTEAEIEGIHLNGGCTELTQELMAELMNR